MKNVTGNVIILHMCTKNHDHIMYAFWDIEYNRHDFFVILAHFLPFYPTIDTENLKLDIILLHIRTINEDHMIYGSWDVKHNRVFCYFGPFFALSPS